MCAGLNVLVVRWPGVAIGAVIRGNTSAIRALGGHYQETESSLCRRRAGSRGTQGGHGGLYL